MEVPQSRGRTRMDWYGREGRTRPNCVCVGIDYADGSKKVGGMNEIIPLISSGTEGPLGLKHLPRLWIKTLLSSAGRLPEGYKDIRPGFDYVVLEGLGIDPDATRDFIFQNQPGYLAFEQWIREQPGVDISPKNIAKINEAIVKGKKVPEARLQILKECGLPEDTPLEDGIMLNNLDDWRSVHEQVKR
ncbi:hypothetical protein BH09VER1_BH09VER1_04060 [soil metagenome]